MTYKINNREYKTWSGKNQHIIDKLVNREVYCCMTSEVEYMLSRVYEGDNENPFDETGLYNTYEDCCCKCESTELVEVYAEDLEDNEYAVEDGFECPRCGLTYTEIHEAKECCSGTLLYKCENCGAIFEEHEKDSKPAEIYEWWAVSNWFGEKLAEQGCVVIPSWGKSYWGRTTTGQSISLDGCVANIAISMEILEGMEHEWGE